MNLPSHLAPEYRRSGIGASEIGAILGVNPYKTALDVYAEKRGLVEPLPDNPALRWGRYLEPAIASAYEEAHGVELTEPGHRVKTFDGVRFLMTPDRLNEDEATIVEIKTAGLWSAGAWGKTGEDGAPMTYAAQVALYLWGFEIGSGCIAALIGGQDYREYMQERDSEVEEAILSAGVKFWRDHVEKGEPPAARGLEDEGRWIERRYKQNLSDALALAGEEEERLLGFLEVVKKDLKNLELHEQEIENKLKLAIGDAAGLASKRFACKWTTSKPSRPTPPKELDLDGLARELGLSQIQLAGLIQKFTAERPGSRRFTFRPLKEAE